METLGERLRYARKKVAGIRHLREADRQMEVMAKSGVGAAVAHSTISSHENDETPPSTDVLLCYAATYGVSALWLLYGTPPIKSLPKAKPGSVQRFTARQLRYLADRLERGADEGIDMLSAEVVSDDELPRPKDKREGGDEEDDDRDLGKSRPGAG